MELIPFLFVQIQYLKYGRKKMTMKRLFVLVLMLMLAVSAAAETLPELEWNPAARETAAVEPAATEEPEPFYLLPESDIRLIEKDELKDVDKETLALMRNEILARHGYPFKKAQYQEYFGSQIWYEENPDFDYNMLSKIEMANVETIKKLEAAK